MKILNIKGQSMFEVLIALFVISMITVGIVSMSTNSLSNSLYSKNKTLASRYTQEASEWIRSQRDENISLFITNTALPLYCLQSLNWLNIGACTATEYIPNTIFLRKVNFTSSQIGCPANCSTIIEATVVTSWDDSKGYHESKSILNFNDIREK